LPRADCGSGRKRAGKSDYRAGARTAAL